MSNNKQELLALRHSLETNIDDSVFHFISGGISYQKPEADITLDSDKHTYTIKIVQDAR